jgi:hypothetical protein
MFIIGIYLSVLVTVTLRIIQRDAANGIVPLFSARNFFLAGILLFQTISGALTGYTDLTEGGAEISNPLKSAFIFSGIVTVFTLLFVVFYRKFDSAERLAAKRTRIRRTSKSSIVVAGVIIIVIGIALRFAGESIPYVAVLLPQMSAGILCAGVALLAMAWARASFNIAIALVLAAGTAASGLALLVGAFGRREILGLLFAIAWGLYWEKWRLMPASRLILRVVLAGVGTAIPFLLFSGARVGGTSADRSLSGQIQSLSDVDPTKIQEAAIASLSGQFAGGISMWIIEARNTHGGYYPLHSLIYFITMPIPRDYWPGKPEGLGLSIVSEAGIRGVSKEHSWGPGLAGHLYHDIVFISLPLYAAILAFAFRYMDARMRFSAGRDPLTIVVFGSALGQILGMPRGDLGLFAFHMVSAYAGAWLVGRMVCGLVLRIDREAEALEAEGYTYDANADDGYADDEHHEYSEYPEGTKDQNGSWDGETPAFPVRSAQER